VQGRILVVEDDVGVRTLVRELLTRAGHVVADVDGGRAALRELFAEPPDLVVLDVGLADLDGWQTLERIRDVSDVPVLMLSGRSAEMEKVRALNYGADDYVTKPFGKQELIARVQALLRRSAAQRADEPGTYSDDVLTVDFRARAVTVHGRPVTLTPLEFRLLSALVRNAGDVLSADQLLELVWKDARGVSRDQVKVYVGYLRRKLAPDAPAQAPIETVRGFGYRYAGTA
jgi:DNA-binding response OmpR family regulator